MDEIKELERKMKGWDCTKCKFRTDIKTEKPITNKGPACEIGWKHNPRTVESTRNLIANGGSVCFRHPMKYL
jgi:hypothetical protein